MATDYGIWQVHVLDLGLQLASVVLGDPSAKGHRDLLRLSDGPIGVEQTLAEVAQG
jgi:hypothetical protein